MVWKRTWKVCWLALILNVCYGQDVYKGWLPYYPGRKADTTIGVYIKNSSTGYVGFYPIRLTDTAKFHFDKTGLLQLWTDTSLKITFDTLYLNFPVQDTAPYFLGIDANGKVYAMDTLIFSGGGGGGGLDSLYFLFGTDNSPSGWITDTVKIDTANYWTLKAGTKDTLFNNQQEVLQFVADLLDYRNVANWTWKEPPRGSGDHFLIWSEANKNVYAMDTAGFGGGGIADSIYVLFGEEFSPSGWFRNDTVKIDTTFVPAGSVDSIYFLRTDEYFTNGWYRNDTVKIDTTFIPPGSVDSVYVWWTDTDGTSGWYGQGDTVLLDTTGSVYDTLVEGFGILPFRYTPSARDTVAADSSELDQWFTTDTVFNYMVDSIFTYVNDSLIIYIIDSLSGKDSTYFEWVDYHSSDGWYGTDDTVRIDTSFSSIVYDTLVDGFGILPFHYTPSLRDTVAADSIDLDNWFVTDTLFNYTIDSVYAYINDSIYKWLYDSLYIKLYDTLLISTIDSLKIYINDSIYKWVYDSLIIYINDSLGGIDSTYFQWGVTHGEDGWYGTGDTVLLDTNYWAKNSNFLYPKQATDSVHIGGNSPAERLEVTGNIALSSQADRKVYVEKSTGAGDDGYDLEIYAGASNDPGMSGTGKGGDVIIHGGLGDGGGSPAGGNVFIYPINQDQDGGLFLNLDTDTLSSDTRIYLGGVYLKDNATDSLLVLSRDHTLNWISKDSIMTNAGDSCLWVIVSGDTIDTKDFNILLDSSFAMKYGDLRLGYGRFFKDMSGYHNVLMHGYVIEGDTLAGAIVGGEQGLEYQIVSSLGDTVGTAMIEVYADSTNPKDSYVQLYANYGDDVGSASQISLFTDQINLVTDSLTIQELPQGLKGHFLVWDSTSTQVFAMDTSGWGGGAGGADSLYVQFVDSDSPDGWFGLGDTLSIDTTGSGSMGGADSIFFKRSDEYFETGWYGLADTVRIDTTGGGGGGCTTPATLAVYSNRTTDMTASDDTCFWVIDPDAEIDFTIPVGSTVTGRSFTVINDNYDADRNKINIKRGSTTDVTVYPDADYYYLSNTVVYTGTEWMIWAMGWEKTEGGFITEWTVSGNEAARTITLPLYNSGTFNCIVDWGDGTAKSDVTAYNDADRIHIYASDGTYQVTIKGECPSWSFNNGGDKLKITKIINWGSSPTFGGFAYLTGGFYGCTNLTSLGHGKILPRSTSLVNLYQIFRDCTSLTTIPNGLFDNCISLAAYAYDQTFYGCTGITTIPDGLFDNGILATTYAFYQTFYGCTGITTIPDGLFDHNTIITTYAFRETFKGCTSIDSIPTGLFNYNKLVSTEAFYQTFYGCTSLDYIPPALFNYNTVVSSSGFYGTFMGCTSLDYIPSGLFYKCTAVSTSGFYQTFRDCTSLDSIGNQLFKSTALTTSGFRQTFYQCISLDSIPDGLFDDCANVSTDGFNGTFTSCQALNYIPDGLFDNNTAVSSNGFYQTFSNCYALDSIPDGLFDNNTAVSSNGFYETFTYCTTLVYMPSMLFANNTACTSWYQCFRGCNKLTEKEEVFYHYSDADSTSRFAGKTIDFTRAFQLTNTFTGTQGKAQRLWNATYGSVTSTQCWNANSTSSLSNYGDIPAGWR